MPYRLVVPSSLRGSGMRNCGYSYRWCLNRIAFVWMAASEVCRIIHVTVTTRIRHAVQLVLLLTTPPTDKDAGS
jgi:hypothetical protein